MVLNYVNGFRFLCEIYSTLVVALSLLADDAVVFTDSSADFDGPVCVIGTTRS